MTDSFDCRVVRMWNEHRDGDYVRRGEVEETVRAAKQMKMTSRLRSSEGSWAVIILHKMDTPLFGLNYKEMNSTDRGLY